uniref:Mur ligase family protein n=1 Tax=Acetivibrio cellulolyticus TaxID=35830 RepID=UPI0002F24A7D|nr:Mur ligase family protein [Acetivibrio cellulolyticus]
MLIAGIISQSNKESTADLINSIFSASKKRFSFVDSKSLTNLDSKRFKAYLSELLKNNTDILILKVNIFDLDKEIFDYLKFDIIIFTDKSDDFKESISDAYKESMRKAFSLLDEKGIAIVNADDNELSNFLNGIKHYIITYGFNLKASITTSSVGDLVAKNNIMCCLQRTVFARNGNVIEPQEFIVKTQPDMYDPYNVLAAATFALVNGVDLNSLNN